MMYKGEIAWVNILYFIQGNLRYKLYYSSFKWLIRKHIKQQIDWRIIKKMNKLCYAQGSCIKCGCQTTHLQMCDRACEGECYPAMMNEEEWNLYKLKNFMS